MAHRRAESYPLGTTLDAPALRALYWLRDCGVVSGGRDLRRGYGLVDVDLDHWPLRCSSSLFLARSLSPFSTAGPPASRRSPWLSLLPSGRGSGGL